MECSTLFALITSNWVKYNIARIIWPLLTRTSRIILAIVYLPIDWCMVNSHKNFSYFLCKLSRLHCICHQVFAHLLKLKLWSAIPKLFFAYLCFITTKIVKQIIIPTYMYSEVRRNKNVIQIIIIFCLNLHCVNLIAKEIKFIAQCIKCSWFSHFLTNFPDFSIILFQCFI